MKVIDFSDKTSTNKSFNETFRKDLESQQKLRLVLQKLSECSLIELVTVVVRGRGDNGEDLQAIYENSQQSYRGDSNYAIQYLLSKGAHLADYIERGLRYFILAS
ncbi:MULTISPECIES: DUF3775 domain-containing protein [unclassified Delftia]|uniref:DUF3775 domain-containing protein n=1 Tax=unclassified Delftia TaxID=2613839 RepID=UPI001902A453|nr:MULTISPECIES: DUF3775 domain-containing protein [unclassified Delftia]MBK0114502.1 DUF3775 domain-containing protein [Delftia sp. S65]MBK0116573.1 DUF3775 domain-containing protein [Delftia sp. S67]MBK0131787.1 DUF3775 domain-containing protein [Delftia sp. S66]